jgi:NADH-quinone oxidoreductase subunit M
VIGLLSVMVFAPAVAAAALLGIPNEQRLAVRLVSLAGASVSLLCSIAAILTYDRSAGGLQLVETHAIVPALGINLKLGLDGWGLALELLTGLIIVAGIFASWTLKEREKEFFILLLVLVAGVFGVFCAQDLFVFFLLYEIAVLPMYLLIAIWGSSHAVTEAGPLRFVWRWFRIGDRRYAAMKLTIMLLVGSAFILVDVLALWHASGGSFDMQALAQVRFDRTMQIWLFPLAWLGFGTLAGVFPFHTWSPDGHASAPTAVSMLHAGVLMKLGAYGVMRVGMVLMPEGALAWMPLVGAVAVVNVVYGALSAISQKDLKYVVAYSSVSHMGVVMLGAATLQPQGWNGAVFQMVAHGIMTGLFFALVGLVYERAHSRAIPEMGGFGRAMPGVAAFFTLAGLSSLGMPGTAGFVAELLVFLGAWASPFPWWAIPGVLGAFLTALYVLRVVRDVFWGDGPAEKFHDLHDARKTEWVALWALGSALVIFGFWPRLLVDLIDPATLDYLGALRTSVETAVLR